MKTFYLPDHNSKKSFFLVSACKGIYQYFIRFITSSNEVQVWQKRDRYGNTYWQAYDPKTGKSTSLGSEAEMRIWIEQRYYQSNYSHLI